ncbi:MAG TPA: peroxide stress protein YaaA [Noviherbaspirillum sp.]|nr:peroxide stress protein YaaA [Noviherbaspirillum sp.]
MLIVLSPAKTLDYATPLTIDEHTLPDFIEDSAELVDGLKRMSPADLSELMGISDALAVLNVTRFVEWSKKFTKKNARQAILAFDGDVYEGLDAGTLTAKQLAYTQAHVRILSGLYGVLRPLDLMQPYRLEMGTRFANARGKDLYAFWGARVTDALNKVLASHKRKVLVNLASEEYFKVVKPKQLDADVITPVFEDWKGGKYKVISFHAKRARGMMTRFAAANGITQVEKLKQFDTEGYAYDARISTESHWVFRRKLEA